MSANAVKCLQYRANASTKALSDGLCVCVCVCVCELLSFGRSGARNPSFCTGTEGVQGDSVQRSFPENVPALPAPGPRRGQLAGHSSSLIFHFMSFHFVLHHSFASSVARAETILPMDHFTSFSYAIPLVWHTWHKTLFS